MARSTADQADRTAVTGSDPAAVRAAANRALTRVRTRSVGSGNACGGESGYDAGRDTWSWSPGRSSAWSDGCRLGAWPAGGSDPYGDEDPYGDGDSYGDGRCPYGGGRYGRYGTAGCSAAAVLARSAIACASLSNLAETPAPDSSVIRPTVARMLRRNSTATTTTTIGHARAWIQRRTRSAMSTSGSVPHSRGARAHVTMASRSPTGREGT